MTSQKELLEFKSKFFASIAHDFRTPLTAILLSTELLENYGNMCSEEQKRQYLHCIREAAEQMNELLNEVLINYDADDKME
ncbi:sensor histidine kinase [Argonema antarcticum]|uniref:sensor histidine kinase n=1 Tax=Argonema antarcticum TaxID=2942763 RepID=UPI002011FA39|nr:histidine kinase dimerization/phospho-acceptor domain-containing protein [Argonema antarcticum]MCL1475448.1 hypothetical protein [Argonema antarcticum A004/B2]